MNNKNSNNIKEKLLETQGEIGNTMIIMNSKHKFHPLKHWEDKEILHIENLIN